MSSYIRKSIDRAIKEIVRCGGEADLPESDSDIDEVWMEYCTHLVRPEGFTEEEYVVDAWVDFENNELVIEHGRAP